MPIGLVGLYEEFKQLSDGIIERFSIPVPMNPPYVHTCPPAHEDGQVFLTVRLQNIWGDYCLRLLEVSAHGGQTGFSGLVISPIVPGSSIAESNRLVGLAANDVAKTKGLQNPVWHSCQFTLLVANELNLSNYQIINSGLGPNVTAGQNNRVRNYVVHPGSGSSNGYSKVAAFYGMPNSEPVALLQSRQRGGLSLFELWVRDLQRAARLAAQ